VHLVWLVGLEEIAQNLIYLNIISICCFLKLVLSPVEVAIEDIQKKIDELRYVTSWFQVRIHVLNIKKTTFMS
jgi:hypothetical protein